MVLRFASALSVVGVMGAAFISGCRPSSEETCLLAYAQDFTRPVIFLVAEINGVPEKASSGFLLNRDKGIFVTAKHFTDTIEDLGKDDFELFINGMMCNVSAVKVFPELDIALVGINGDFDPQKLPQPYPIADSLPQIGDTIYLEGFHSHPYLLRQYNKNRGVIGEVVPIFKDYYGIIRVDSMIEQEVVFERIPAHIFRIDTVEVFIEDSSQKKEYDFRANITDYFYARAYYNHLISLKGLSGGAVLNKKGEVVGVFVVGSRIHMNRILFVPLPKIVVREYVN